MKRAEYWFNRYEKTGFLDTFDSPYETGHKYNGMRFKVLSRCGEGWDSECLPAWNIQLENGDKLEAYPEEICKSERDDSREYIRWAR